MSDIKPGDVVRLKSGGPLMTVSSIDGKLVNVCWFSGDTPKFSKLFPDCLDCVEDKILKHALDHNAHLNIFRAGAKSTES